MISRSEHRTSYPITSRRGSPEKVEFSDSEANFRLRIAGRKKMIGSDEIKYLKSAKNYTVFKLTNGKEIISSKTLKVFEDELNGVVNFIRPHRSYLVNFNHVTNLQLNCRGGEIVLGDETLEISRRKAAKFRKEYQKFLMSKGRLINLTMPILMISDQ